MLDVKFWISFFYAASIIVPEACVSMDCVFLGLTWFVMFVVVVSFCGMDVFATLGVIAVVACVKDVNV